MAQSLQLSSSLLGPFADPDSPKTVLVNAFRELLASGKGSDLTIMCGAQPFKVHKAIICSRSDFFAAACWGNFKEAKSNRIDLPEDDPAVVKKMLNYLYTMDYTKGNPFWSFFTTSPFPDLAFHASIYGIADKYSIAGLKDLAVMKLNQSLRSIPGFSAAGHTQLHTADGIRELVSAVETAWTTTPAADKGMRDPLLKYCKEYLQLLMEVEEFKNVMVEVTDFVFDLLAQEVRDRLGGGVAKDSSASKDVVSKEAVETTTARFPLAHFTFGRRV